MEVFKFCTHTVVAENPIRLLIKLNCILRDLTQAYQFSDAIRLFQQIHSSHQLKPDEYSVSTALTGCGNFHDKVVGSQLHAYSLHSALLFFPHVSNNLLSFYAKSGDLDSVRKAFDEIEKPDVYSCTTLLSACTKLGEVDRALFLFDKMPKCNVPVWNALITGCAENGHDEIAFDLFCRMHAFGIKADNYTFACVLSLCSLKQLDFGRQLHAAIIKNGIFSRASVVNSLVTMYFDCGSGVCAYDVFEEVNYEVRNEITYNAIIAGLGSMEQFEDSLMMFKEMQFFGLKPTELTFVSVMGPCLCSRVGSGIHCQAKKMGFEGVTSVNNAAISMYFRCGNSSSACMVFRELNEKDIVSWNAVIAGYAHENLGADATFAFIQMRRNGIEPDEFTIGGLLVSSQLLEMVEMIHAVVVKNALILKIEVSNALISALSNHYQINQASQVFYDMCTRNLISWNALISGYRTNGLFEQGLEKFLELLQAGLRPNHFTLSLVLNIFTSISDLQHGKQIHAYILKLGYFSRTLLGNSLITFYANVGKLDWSFRVFQSMVDKDTFSWNSMISTYAQNGEGKQAIECFKCMKYSGEVTPDKATFTSLLSACSHSGLVSDGLEIFSLMVNGYGIEPDVSHFSCIIDLLGRAGFLDEAESVVSSRSIGVDSSVWWTLFSSCATHDYLQLGDVVAGFLLETQNEDPGVYVLLSNIYANAGKWEESANVRQLMKNYGARKQPGSSWIGAA